MYAFVNACERRFFVRITMAFKLDFDDLPELALQARDNNVDNDQVKYLDTALHEQWGLGRNLILVWTPADGAIDLLVIPHYALSEYVMRTEKESADPEDYLVADPYARARRSENVIEGVISGPKQVEQKEMEHLCRLLGYETTRIDLPFSPGTDLPNSVIETLVKRYSISYVEDRAVALFDIVGFSLLSPLEQVTQLNSLAFSVNSAYSKMLNNNIDISFARTTTGDGFYVWNRDRSIQANVNLYHFMHLVLADNAIATRKSSNMLTPKLRAAFHVGGHYEFYQSEGLSPTLYSYIVGDVTIELARMLERALPGQVLVGDFWVSMPDWEHGHVVKIDTLQFISKAQETLSSLKGLVISGDSIDGINCYLTGDRTDDDEFGVHRYAIADKHHRLRNVYNAKINIYRGAAEPIYLGLQSNDMDSFETEKIDLIVMTESSTA